MKTVTCVSAADTKKVWRLCGILFLLGALGALLVTLNVGQRLVMQLMMVGSITVAIYFWLSYIATSFVYEIGEENGTVFFLVYKKQGKKSITQARLPLSALEAISKSDAAHPLSSALYQKKYRYSAAFFPEGYDVLFFRDGETVALEISADEPFLAVLSAYLAEKEQAEASEDGEAANEAEDIETDKTE